MITEFLPDVGPLTYIAPGKTHFWTYGWGDRHGEAMCLAGPNLDRNGSYGSRLFATEQGKQSILLDRNDLEYYVRIRNDGPELVLYNLQVVSFR